MSYEFVQKTIDVLNENGIPAEHGYPGLKMKELESPAVMVTLHQAAIRDQTMTVLATVLSPAALGIMECEQVALNVCTALTQIGADCSMGQCGFDGRTGLFCGEVSAKFLTAIPKVKLEDTTLQYVEAFTCWRTVDEDAGITKMEDAKWNFRLEEFFPLGAEEEPQPEEPFVLMFISHEGSETYTDCQWTYHRRVWGSTGIRQIRLGTAESMQNG